MPMMKPSKQIIFLILISASFLSVNGQLLNNTRWKSYDALNNFDLFWNFNNDTVAYSPDNMNWTSVSVYVEAGNIVTFRDIIDVGCDTSIVGVYQFSLLLDTLRITILNEPCTSRSDYFTTHYFVDFPIGINEAEAYKNISLYPLPFDRELNVKTESGSFEFSLFDITGSKVIGSSFCDQVNFDTGDLQPGMYLYELRVAGRIAKSGTIVKY
jgi:hypothetical protein